MSDEDMILAMRALMVICTVGFWFAGGALWHERSRPKQIAFGLLIALCMLGIEASIRYMPAVQR